MNWSVYVTKKNTIISQNFHTKKLGEITVFFVVYMNHMEKISGFK